MDEIEQRLKEATDGCIKSYDAWRGDKKSEEARENLAEAIHELRKVASRLEIEIAVSEREQMSNKPIAIPPHRSSRKGGGAQDMGYDDNDDIGNAMPDDNAGNNANGGGQQRRPNNMRRSGGGGGGGRGRRPGGGRPNNQGND